jgi:hypothetical protein
MLNPVEELSFAKIPIFRRIIELDWDQIDLSPCQAGPMLRLLRLIVVFFTRLFFSRRDLLLGKPGSSTKAGSTPLAS